MADIQSTGNASLSAVDDFLNIFDIKPSRFSIGSMKGPIFLEGFSKMVDYGKVKLFKDLKLFFRIPIQNLENTIVYPVLQGSTQLQEIRSVQLVKLDRYNATLTFTFRRPPRIEADFRRTGIPNPEISLRRATESDWSPREETGSLISPLPSSQQIPRLMKFGLWMTYRFQFTCTPFQYQRIRQALHDLRTLNRPGTDGLEIDSEVPRSLFLTSNDEEVDDVDEFLLQQNLDFETRYLIIGLISYGVVLVSDAAQLVHILWNIHKSKRLPVLNALYRCDSKQLSRDLKGIIHRLSLQVEPLRSALPLDRVRIKHVTVTPTRVLLYPDHIETSNSVLRQWPAHVDKFIRVRFADEDDTKISVRDSHCSAGGRESALLNRVKRILREGLMIAGRHYVALATGESQMKDGSCWMIFESDEFTADNVRATMGNFSLERSVAKFSARMGLCFSSSCLVVDLQPEHIETVPDIRHGKYTYTDGVGNCSPELAALCAKILGSSEANPSAIQIRMGGFKGVLSVKPSLTKNQVCVRPSMKKFDSQQCGLGVMRVSHYAPAHLNRQAIIIITALGADISVLLNMFEAQIAHAEGLERNLASLDDSKLPQKNLYRNSFLPVARLVKHGLAQETMLRNVVRCITCQLLRELKYKARILVPEGAYLMGIADEFGILQEGEIYCPITPSECDEVHVVTGQCTIFRSPCNHPGDVRLVTAVDCPQFHHPEFYDNKLKNVVVFSTKKSARDLPSMLSGGDLDGDFYTIIYDKNLQITEEHEPMDYTPVLPVLKDRVLMRNLMAFHVDFMINDKLGIVAHSLQAWADKVGPRAPQCLQLAKLNSDAVDFSKSGVPVRVPPDLNPDDYPDFMSKDSKPSYLSDHVLGVMYRLINPAPEYIPVAGMHSDPRLLYKVVSPNYLNAAGAKKRWYDIELQAIMRQYSLSEGEIFAGVSITHGVSKRRGGDAMRGPVQEAMDALWRTFRAVARDFVKKNPAREAPRRGQPPVIKGASIAFSEEGYESDGNDNDVEQTDLISFPWLWAHELCHSLEGGVIKEEEEENGL
ncbi:RNA dependent RNA polymerase-domain-containing protein [Mycena capillaripes]|nr:RNA dependent RNA polymerase-domain-containing protein [Mycena capillaripes]